MNRLYKMSLPHLFTLLSVICAFLFIYIGWLFGNASITFSSPSMRQAMSQLSHHTIVKAVEAEIPYLKFKEAAPGDSPKPISLFLFETLTSLKPTDLRSLLGRELPGLPAFNAEVIQVGRNVNLQHYVIESSPPIEALDTSAEESKANGKAEKQENKQAALPTKERTVLIYTTHNTESWSFITKNESVTDNETNITMVSKKLSDELQKHGIKTVLDQTDHQQLLNEKGLPYAFSYAASLKTVQAAIQQNNEIGFIFDIHRDTPGKEQTTVKIKGKSYARPFFVVGKRNPHWEKNAQLANKFHELLEKKYPGLSIGVFAKGAGNGEYNQSVSPNSLLIEIGGVENTLQECYNTAAALADVFADIYFETDKKVDKPIAPAQKSM